MPSYKEGSARSIVVPSSGGVLSDEYYEALTPRSYMLDNAIQKCSSIKDDISLFLGTHYDYYIRKITALEEKLGVAFFSLNGQDLNIINASAELQKQNSISDNVIEQLSSLLSEMNSINSKLSDVEKALRQMNSKYTERKEIVNKAYQETNAYAAAEPNPNSYAEESEYQIAYNHWKQEYTRLQKRATELEQQLENDVQKTKSMISVTWFCQENGG